MPKRSWKGTDQVAQRSGRNPDTSVAALRRRQIIDSARAIIEEQGTDKATLRNVARRANVSHGTVTYYFKTRKAMVDAALLDAGEHYLQRLRENHQPPHGPATLVEFAENFLDPEKIEGSFVLELLDAGVHDVALQRAHTESMKLGGSWVEEAVRAGIDSGYYRSDVDPHFAAAAFHAALLWVGFQMRGGTVTPEHAWAVAHQALDLLKSQPLDQSAPDDEVMAHRVPYEDSSTVIRRLILSDERLSHENAVALSSAFENLYRITLDASSAKTQ
jgi:AcrR family transcriptional regulator